MSKYIVVSSHMKPSKIKGELPDIIHQYIANDSTIPYHYAITRNKEDAYIFDEFEMNEAKFIASCWNMKVQKIDT